MSGPPPPPPPPRRRKRYPIHNTSGGADHGKEVPGKYTHNPIPEETVVMIEYGGRTVKMEVNMNFYSNPDLIVFRVKEG